MSNHPNSNPPIAIVGVSALFPGSTDGDGFWRDILEGRDLIGDVPASHWLVEDYFDEDPKAPDKTYARRGAFIDPVDFDALGWGIPPSIVPATDTSQLLALIVAERVLSDASRNHAIDKSRTSVILGVTSAQELLGAMVSRLQHPVWKKALREMGLPESQVKEACDRISAHYTPWQEATFPGLLGNVVAGRIANRLDLGGTNCVTDAACASTFSALSMAVNELRLGQSDLAIAGGVDTMNDIFMFMCFSKTPALSPTGDCRPFSAAGDGTMLGEGLGMFALKRLADAERDDDRIYAVIRGIGAGSDGRAKSVYAPLAEGQARTLRRAYEAAGYGPETVELVEAHGTGTRAGDAAEFSGLAQVFGQARAQRDDDGAWCALGSVKSQIGHTKAAAGAAGLFKAVMALNEGVLPPSIKIEAPNPKMDLEGSPFHLATRALPWVRGSDHARRASVSSFGFGGSNFHIALEESPRGAPRRNALPLEAVAVGADSAEGLRVRLQELAAEIQPGRLRHLARSSHSGFSATDAPHRAVLVAKNETDLSSRVNEAIAHLDARPQEPLRSPLGVYLGAGAPDGEIAFIFPGQGSQYVDMGADLAVRLGAARGAWDLAADLDLGEVALHRIVFPPTAFDDEGKAAQAARLTRTEWAQPALGAASLAVARVLERAHVKPAMLGGHSFGEIAALATAGVLTPRDMLRVARRRGELMAEAAKIPGAMMAVVAPIERVRAILEDSGAGAEVANHNAPKQVVIAGALEAIAAAERAFAAAEIATQRLPVATAFHSKVVASAATPFARALADVPMQSPSIPVFANTTARVYGTDPASIRATLSGQLASPVRFVEMISAMYEAGARTFVEVGAGSVLTGLIGRILDRRPHHAVAMDRKGKSGFETLLHGLAELAALGVQVDFESLLAEYETPEDPAARAKPKLAVSISGTNSGRPYPPVNGAAGRPGPNPERAPTAQRAPAPAAQRAPAPAASMATTPAAPVAAAPAARAQAFLPSPPASPGPAIAGLSSAPSPVPPIASAHGGAMTAARSAPPSPSASPQGPLMSSKTPPRLPTASASAWLAAWESAQAETARAHAAYQEAMARSHGAYLDLAEASLTTLSGLAGDAAALTATSVSGESSNGLSMAAFLASPAETNGRAALANGHGPVGTNGHGPGVVARPAAPSVPADAPLPRVDAVPPASPATPPLASAEPPRPTPAAAPSEAPAAQARLPSSAAPAVDLEAKLRAVVAEATGYPEDVLEPAMSLEADLGIDSIKRVEILSLVKKAVPELPELDAATLGSLETLGDVAQHLQQAMGASAPPPATAPAAQASLPSSAAPAVDLEAKLRAVVAEATGYPEDVLEPAMSLEADLGIDSIKRVEILSLVKKAVPELPELDAATLGSLETLGDVAQHLQQAMGASPPALATAPAAQASLPPAPTVDLEAKLRAVVAEATGYPEDVLEPAMSLEADLGIDSIKRVEILSLVKKAVPELPELDAATLGSLETLGDVAQHLQLAMGASPPAPAAAPAAQASLPPTPTVDLEAKLRAVVAEATGYPEDVLEPAMSLEADLGIDSIKRVEILSLVKKAVPELPELDAATLGSLETLGDVAQHLQQAMGTPALAVSGAPSRPAEARPALEVPALHRYEPVLVDAPPAGFSRVRAGSLRSVAVVGGPPAVREAVARRLSESGVLARAVEAPRSSDDGVVLLHGLEAVEGPAEAVACGKRAFLALRSATSVFEIPGALIASVQDTGGGFAIEAPPSLERAPLAGLAALVKTAGLEAPEAVAMALDIATDHRSPDEVADLVTAELLAGGLEREVAYAADGTRRTVGTRASSAGSADLVLRPGDVVIASGGARGVTAHCLRNLAHAVPARFVLLGRTPLEEEPEALRGAADEPALKRALLEGARVRGEKAAPAEINRVVARVLAAREVRATLEAIGEAGAEATYLAVDVSDASALARALADVRAAWGPISAIVHAAGVIHDKRILDKSEDQLQRVVGTKVGGLLALLEATRSDPLKAIVLFSSVAAHGGNVGQADYAMANAGLDAIAAGEAARRPECVVKSLGWGPWRGGMVSAALEARFEAAGVPLVGLDQGPRWMLEELRTPGAPRVLLGGAPRTGPLLPGVEPTPARLFLEVDGERYPELADHAVEGPPVVPVVLVMDWMLRTLAGLCPGAAALSLEEVRVRRGIPVTGWPTEALHLCVTATPAGEDFALQLLDDAGHARYTAIGRALDALPPGIAEPEGLPAATSTSPYGGVLFHGPRFQALAPLEGLDRSGARGRLLGGVDLGWMGQPGPGGTLTDPVRLDGALQLAVLVTEGIIAGASLPTRVGRIAVVRDATHPGPGIAWSVTREHTADQAVHDLVVHDGAGRVAAVFEGLETTRRPGWTPTR